MPPRHAVLLVGLFFMNGCSPAEAAPCFAPGTELPQAAQVRDAPGIGSSAAALIEAMLGRDPARARALLAEDPALARQRLGGGADMLTLAVASCDRSLVDAVIAAGGQLDGTGRGLPLTLALRSSDPWFAQRLLSAGASPTPAGDPTVPMRTAIGLNAPGGVLMLLDSGADPNIAERTGRRPLHIAVDQERFHIVEILLDRGADPWAIDVGGANLGTGSVTPMMTRDPAEAAAQARLRKRVEALHWPQPIPNSRAVRQLAAEGRWPPPGSNAPPVPAEVLEKIRKR